MTQSVRVIFSDPLARQRQQALMQFAGGKLNTDGTKVEFEDKDASNFTNAIKQSGDLKALDAGDFDMLRLPEKVGPKGLDRAKAAKRADLAAQNLSQSLRVLNSFITDLNAGEDIDASRFMVAAMGARDALDQFLKSGDGTAPALCKSTLFQEVRTQMLASYELTKKGAQIWKKSFVGPTDYMIDGAAALKLSTYLIASYVGDAKKAPDFTTATSDATTAKLVVTQ